MSQRQSQQDFWSQRTVRGEVAASQRLPRLSQHSSPHPLAPLPDLVRKHPQGDPAECDREEGKGKRRSVAEITLEMYNKGAYFLEFEHPLDSEGRPVELDQKGESDFRQMEKKGFLVTVDGCLIPYDQYCTRATLRGHQRSAYFFTGLSTQFAAEFKKRKCATLSSALTVHTRVSVRRY